MDSQRPDLFTIGHSTHSLEEFLGLLARHGVSAVADVRSQPYGRLLEFGREALAAALKLKGIEYLFFGRELGARREETDCYVNGQAVYERVAELPLFREGLIRLERMRSQLQPRGDVRGKEPLDCHRTVLVCRHLRRHGLHIQHILADGELEDHAQTEKRMVRMMGITRDLFRQDIKEEDLIEEAYVARGKQIAYCAGLVGAAE